MVHTACFRIVILTGIGRGPFFEQLEKIKYLLKSAFPTEPFTQILRQFIKINNRKRYRQRYRDFRNHLYHSFIA